MVFVSLFSTSAIAKAETETNDDNEILLRYSTIAITSTSFSISGVKATCTASLKPQYSTNLKIVMELQKKKSSGYETVETWTSSTTGISLSTSKSRTINVLSTYRLKVTYTAGSETTVVYKY
jgi:hypothetical protein